MRNDTNNHAIRGRRRWPQSLHWRSVGVAILNIDLIFCFTVAIAATYILAVLYAELLRWN